ncbi:DUF2061 domain-containing protein [Candidatus Microgenomates bacterium]|nr:DUF2061 domain-containing protein [Candidatus Microgenomates bacterium]
MKVKYHEKVERSVVKAITFRILILIADSIVIYALTKRVDITAGVVFVSNISSTILYFIHERAWNNIHWGKKVKK